MEVRMNQLAVVYKTSEHKIYWYFKMIDIHSFIYKVYYPIVIILFMYTDDFYWVINCCWNAIEIHN